MDQELKQYLVEMEGRINGRFEQVDDRLKQVDARFQQIDARFQQIDDQSRQMETRLKEHMAGVVDAAKEEMKDFTREAVRDMETRIVGSFSEVIAAQETRTRTNESVTKTITDSVLERMSLLESRMLRLERGRLSQ